MKYRNIIFSSLLSLSSVALATNDGGNLLANPIQSDSPQWSDNGVSPEITTLPPVYAKNPAPLVELHHSANDPNYSTTVYPDSDKVNPSAINKAPGFSLYKYVEIVNRRAKQNQCQMAKGGGPGSSRQVAYLGIAVLAGTGVGALAGLGLGTLLVGGTVAMSSNPEAVEEVEDIGANLVEEGSGVVEAASVPETGATSSLSKNGADSFFVRTNILTDTPNLGPQRETFSTVEEETSREGNLEIIQIQNWKWWKQ